MNSYNPFQQFQPYIDPINGSQGFDSATSATTPFQQVYIPSKTFIIDSRQRDCKIYPSPSHYKISNLGDIFKNVTSIELTGAIIPKSSYNIHAGNNKIDFSIGSSITSIKLTNKGLTYTSVPNVSIGAPYYNTGTQATATAILDPLNSSIMSIQIINPGSGYLASIPPTILIDGPTTFNATPENIATAVAKVGTWYSAELRPGQYTIGGNPAPPAGPSGLILEIQNAMNYAVNGGAYDPASVAPFEVRLVSQYPELNATAGDPDSFETNSTKYNRIQFTNVNSVHWELLFCSGPNKKNSAQSVLGFPWMDQWDPTLTVAVSDLISAGTTLRAHYDYDLLDDPKYVLLSLSFAGEGIVDRTLSNESSLDRKFGIVFFDANTTDNIKDTSGSETVVSGVSYLRGPVTKGTFWSGPGTLKPLRGSEYDHKKISFMPPIGKLTDIEIQFTCYGSSGNVSTLYDFQGRDNTLVFEVMSADQKSARS